MTSLRALCGSALRFAAAATLAISIAIAPARAQNSAARFAAVRDTIRVVMESLRMPSVAVAVAKGGKILWEEGFGMADRERQVPATAQTMYSLASISKPFTATGLMVLVERGAVDIDRPANQYLGATKLRAPGGDPAALTVRRIMTHSASLPLHYQFFYDGVAKAHSDDEAIAKYGFAGYAPGTAYLYSNLGYGIIGYIAGRVSGRGYEAFMRDEVFAPLGLTNTTVSTGRELGPRAAVRYDNDLKPIAPYGFDHTGASGVWSSAHDLVRFGMFHLGNATAGQRAILSVATRERMQQPGAPETTPGQSYGLGWGTSENTNGYRQISHTGGMPGVTTVLNLYPTEEVAIVVLTNRSSPGIARIAGAIANEMLPNYATNRAANLAAQRATALEARGTSLTSPPPSPLAVLAGTWSGTTIVGRDTMPLSFDIRTDGTVKIRFAAVDTTVSGNAANGFLNVRFTAALRAPDATPSSDRSPVTAVLTLRIGDSRMTGWLSSMTSAPPVYGAVSYYAEVKR